MLQISTQAGQVLLESLQATGVNPGQALRLKQQGSEFSLEIDNPSDTDRVIEHQEQAILIVEPSVDDVLSDAIIDIQEGQQGPSLTILRQA